MGYLISSRHVLQYSRMDGARTLTVQFDGHDLSTGALIAALSRFDAVLHNAAKTVLKGTGAPSEWKVHALSYNSPLRLEAEPKLEPRFETRRTVIVERVRGLISGRQRNPSPAEKKAVDSLRAVLNGKITGVVVSTRSGDATLRPLPPKVAEEKQQVDNASFMERPVLGTVSGRAYVVNIRKDLLFELDDPKSGNVVLCYLEPQQRAWLDGLLGQMVEVDGLISRDAVSGKPIAVRSITRIEERELVAAGAFDQIPGLFKDRLNVESDEAVRRIRNGEV